MSTCPCGSAIACRSDVEQKSHHKNPSINSSLLFHQLVMIGLLFLLQLLPLLLHHMKGKYEVLLKSGDYGWEVCANCSVCDAHRDLLWHEEDLRWCSVQTEVRDAERCLTWGQPVLQRNREYDRYEGVAHSFRQPYFRDWVQRSHWTRSLSLCIFSTGLHTHPFSDYLNRLCLGLQYPLSCFEDVEEKYWLSLWWNVIVVSLSGCLGEVGEVW